MSCFCRSAVEAACLEVVRRRRLDRDDLYWHLGAYELYAQLAPEEGDVQNRHAAGADVLERTAAPSKRHKRTREPGGRRR